MSENLKPERFNYMVTGTIPTSGRRVKFSEIGHKRKPYPNSLLSYYLNWTFLRNIYKYLFCELVT